MAMMTLPTRAGERAAGRRGQWDRAGSSCASGPLVYDSRKRTRSLFRRPGSATKVSPFPRSDQYDPSGVGCAPTAGAGIGDRGAAAALQYPAWDRFARMPTIPRPGAAIVPGS